MHKSILYVVNVDWYFDLHWMDRVRASIKKGYKVSVAVKITNTDLEEKFKKMGLRVYDVPFSRKFGWFRELLLLKSLARVIDSSQLDICHAITIKACFSVALLSFLLRTKLVVYSFPGLGRLFSTKGGVLLGVFRNLVKLFFRIVFRFFRSSTTFENNDDRALLLGKCGHLLNRAKVLPGAGVNTERFCYLEKIFSKNLIVLFSGRLLKAKGLYDLVRVVDLMRANDFPVELWVAGVVDIEGEGSISNDRLLSLCEQGSIQKLFLNAKNIEEIIWDSDVVCLPTYYGEGIPRALIEGASCGRAVVTYDVSGCKDFVRNNENGFLIKKGDVQALYNSLVILCNNRKLVNNMGLRGREIVESEYRNDCDRCLT